MLYRLAQSTVGILLALDMLAQSILWFLPSVLFGVQANPRWTISGRAGWLAAHGFPWLADLIDDMPWFGAGHCARSYAFDAEIAALPS